MDQQQLETTETSSPDATRDDLIAAVREAGGTEGVDVAETDEAGEKPAPATTAGATATPPAPAVDEQDAKLEAILKRREEQHLKRRDADEYARQIRAAADAEKQRLIDEARAEAKRIADQELAELRAKFRSSPQATLRALGDPGEIADLVIKEDTPEARALAKLEAEARSAREEAKEGRTAREELAKFKAELAQAEQARLVAEVRQDFLSMYASEEKAPYLHARWEPEEVFERCDRLCREWERDGLKLGSDFDQNTLVAYLEKQSKERVTRLTGTSPANQVPAGAPAKGPGLAPKVQANGSRTLSAAAGSERRTSPRPLSEMKPDEARDALIEEVAAARRANPDATS